MAGPDQHRRMPRTMSDLVLAVGYVRVSTDDQAQHGTSLAVQRDRLAAYCTAKGWKLSCVYEDDGVSGSSLDRAGLAAAFDHLESNGASVLLAVKLDRFTRSVVDFYALQSRCSDLGVQLCMVEDPIDADTADGRLMATIKAGLSQHERERIAERTKAALAFKLERGEWVGLPPFGFRVNGTGGLVEAPDELAVIRTMKRWRRRGMSYRKIAAKLNAEGVKSRRGKWGDASIRRLVNDHLKSRKARYTAR